MNESKDLDKIEIRSEKVRKIIGTIPHKIIYFGYSLFSLILFILLMFGYFFKSSYHINSTIEITSKSGTVIGLLKIPALDYSKVDIGNKVNVSFFDFNNVTITSTVETLSNEVIVINNSLYCLGYIKMNDSLITDSGINFKINNTLVGNATIITKQYRLFDHIAFSFKLKKHK